jgi:hypothetical protein
MTEGYNPFPGIIVVETTCELQNTDTSGLDDGCLAYVKTKGAGLAVDFHYFRLYDYRVGAPPPNGTTILSTYNGPPSVQQGINWNTAGAVCAQQGDAHHAGGTVRWILTDIIDNANA